MGYRERHQKLPLSRDEKKKKYKDKSTVRIELGSTSYNNVCILFLSGNSIYLLSAFLFSGATRHGVELVKKNPDRPTDRRKGLSALSPSMELERNPSFVRTTQIARPPSVFVLCFAFFLGRRGEILPAPNQQWRVIIVALQL